MLNFTVCSAYLMNLPWFRVWDCCGHCMYPWDSYGVIWIETVELTPSPESIVQCYPTTNALPITCHSCSGPLYLSFLPHSLQPIMPSHHHRSPSPHNTHLYHFAITFAIPFIWITFLTFSIAWVQDSTTSQGASTSHLYSSLYFYKATINSTNIWINY